MFGSRIWDKKIRTAAESGRRNLFFVYLSVPVLTALFFSAPASAQERDTISQVDVVDYLVRIFNIKNSEQRRDNRKIRFSFFPVETGSTGGRALVTAFNLSFVTGEKKNTNVSSVYFIPYLSFSNQFGFIIRPSIWLNGNSWYFNGEWFMLRYPQYSWGTGGNSPEEHKTLISYDHIRIHQNVLKGLPANFALGPGYALDHHYNISVEENEEGREIGAYTPGSKSNTTSSGLTFSFVYDRRYNLNNPPHGGYVNMLWRYNSEAFGGNNEWGSLYLDCRKYFSLSRQRQSIIALRGYYWTIISGTVPYLDLPSNGWEPGLGMAARGLQQNRYKSNAFLYFESEYRFDIMNNGFLGGVVFANITGPSDYQTQHFSYWHPAGGCGLRMKLNKYSRTNVTLDYGMSKEFWTVYVGIGETF